MAYAFQDDLIGLPGMMSVDDYPRGPALPGMLAHAVDPVLGGGEFVYLQNNGTPAGGPVPLAAGTLVKYHQLESTTTPAQIGAHGDQPLAVAMGSVGPNQYGWFQITGFAQILNSGAAIPQGSPVGLSSTPGAVVAVPAAEPASPGTMINAVAMAALATDVLVNVQISRPFIM
jgi:hypothetical protein